MLCWLGGFCVLSFFGLGLSSPLPLSPQLFGDNNDGSDSNGFSEHAQLLGPLSEQRNRSHWFNCSSASNCKIEAASACNSTTTFFCLSWAVSPDWNSGQVAQLYSTDIGDATFNASWTL